MREYFTITPRKGALKILEKTLGSDHSDVAITLENMAALYKEIGKKDEAVKFAKRARKIRCSSSSNFR